MSKHLHWKTDKLTAREQSHVFVDMKSDMTKGLSAAVFICDIIDSVSSRLAEI